MGPLRCVCGQTIRPIAMICASLKCLTDLSVHISNRFALFGQNRRNLRRRIRHPKQRNLLYMARTDEVQIPPMTSFFLFFLNFGM